MFEEDFICTLKLTARPVNGDGKKDLLASTNEANGRGGVYAYEQPQGAGNWRTERHQ